MADNMNTYIFLCVSSAVSGAASYAFFRLYRSRSETAREIRHMIVSHPDAQLENQLQASHYLDYVAVDGIVKELGNTLRSRHGKGEGLVMRSQIVEHRLKFENGFWVDTKRVIRDTLDVVPFAIVKESKDDPKYRVEVTLPDKASLLRDELETTYDWFEPNKNAGNLFAGEFTKGFQITERMLPTGANILGVGKVLLEHGHMKLAPPTDSRKSYILTRMKLLELVQHYETQSANYKMLAGITACIGGSFLVYGLCRYIVNWLQQHRQRLMFAEIRRSLAEQRLLESQDVVGNETEEDGLRPEEDTCVVCLSNASQVISLPCRHFNMCVSCAEALPKPKRCPVCRADIERFIAMYHPELD